MEPFRHELSHLFTFGNDHSLHRAAPEVSEIDDLTVVDYLTDWIIQLYNDGRIDTRDVRAYIDIIVDDTGPQMARTLYTWARIGATV